VEQTLAAQTPSVTFETSPDRYKHWKLSFDGPVATLVMDVKEDAGLRPNDYKLKLNSYDLGVDIELADALQRIRFEHPEVHAVVLTSLKPRIFCAGANIFMLGSSSHGFKVNFCKFTNETRLGMEDMSAHSGVKFLAALNGICAGGGYELALACDEIYLVDDGNASVALPETPLLGVLPGTGGLTRVVDKRKVRRDLADAFSTIAEGVRGKRAVEWRLVDKAVPPRSFQEAVATRAQELAAQSDRPESGPGITLGPLNPSIDGDTIAYRYVRGTIDRAKRLCELTVSAPDTPQPRTADEFVAAGDQSWALRAFRELDDTLLRLRLNEPEIGTVLIRAAGDPQAVLDVDATLDANRNHWLVREIIGNIRRTLKRLDLTARSLFAIIEPGNAFAGTLFELALAADRAYMLDHPDEENTIHLSVMNGGSYPMSNGPWGTGAREGSARARRAVRRAGRARGRPRVIRAGRYRLGRRSAHGHRRAHGVFARRVDRHGSQPALRRSRDDGDQDLRPAHGVAELDFPAAERGRRTRRPHGVRQRRAANVRLEENLAGAGHGRRLPETPCI
jgi:benzoyl-CoA-dihydrodiol lyase